MDPRVSPPPPNDGNVEPTNNSKEEKAPSAAGKDVGSKRQATSVVGSVQENGEYEVEKIVAKWVDVETGELLYCVKWLGYDEKENTWEPLCNLVNCAEMVEEFEDLAKALEEKESKS